MPSAEHVSKQIGVSSNNCLIIINITYNREVWFDLCDVRLAEIVDDACKVQADGALNFCCQGRM